MWNDLTMKERADLIKQGVALGYKDIDAIRNNYHTFSKGSTVYTDSNPYYNRLPDSKKKEWRSLSARRQQFLKLMQQYAPQLYNDSQLRNVMEYIAFNEGRWGNTGVSKQGARGYFQLMPDTIATASRNAGRNYNINNPADDFAMTQITAQNSMKYIQKLWQNPEFRRKAEEKGYTPYDLLMSSWLAGPTGMKNNILKGTNPKDAYGTSIGAYVGNTDSQPGTNTMVINTGIEGKPVIITSTPEVEEAIRQNDMPNDETVSNVPVQQDQDVSNTYLLDQYNRILGDNEALRGQYEELSEQERQLKERYEEVLKEQEQEDQAKYLRSLLNIGRTTPIMQVPALGTISTQSTGSINDPYSNNNILAQQMYGTKMGNMRNGSFGKYFFNNPEERTPVVVNYNPYSPIQGGFAYGGNVHRFDEGDTVVTRPPLQAAQNQFAVPEYHYYDDWDPEQFYPTTKIGGAIYDNFDANAPAEPIQSYPNIGEVNPVYQNPTVKGEPVKILHRVQNNDQQAVAQYQDGELGIVNLPDNYWQRYLPEVVVPGRMQQLQGVIDQANEGKTIFEQQQDMEDAFRYQDEAKRAQQDSFYNPRAILDNTSRIPIIGALPAMSEYAYGMLKGGPEGQYWKDRASGAAEEQLLPIGLIAANSNPVTAAMADSTLLGSSLYDINRNGINGENAVGLALGMLGPTVRGTQLVRNNTLPYNLGNVDVTGKVDLQPIIHETADSSPYKYKDPNVSIADKFKDFMTEQQLNEVRQYMQKGRVPDKHVLKTGVKKFVEGKDGVWEEVDVKELPEGWDRVVYDHLPEEVLEELENSTKPRMLAMRTDNPENVLDNDYKTQLFNQAWNKAVTNRNWIGVSDRVWQDYNKIGDNRTLAYITGDGKTIVANKDRPSILLNDDLGHEAEHGIDFEHEYNDILQRTKEEDALLHNAYNEEFDNVPTVEWTKLDKDYNMDPERKTLNRDARRKLLGSSGVRKLPWRRQNKFIEEAPKEKVIEAVRKADGYGQAYIELLEKKYGEIPDDIVNAMRKAMMYVGVGTGAVVIVNNGRQ